MLRKVVYVWPRLLALFSAAALADETPPTFNRDVAPILYEKCARCHRPGEVAPFPLLSYKDAGKRAALIAQVTSNRVMPPWKPDPGPVPFRNEGRLSDAQIATLQEWSASGAAEGDPVQKRPLPQFAEGWQFGRPDQVYTLPFPVVIPADGPDLYRCLVLPADSLTDRYVSGFEFRPQNRRVVHHAFLFVDTSGAARRLDNASPEPGYACVGTPGFAPAATLGIWAPGWPMPPLPDGIAQRIPKRADLVVQIHYHPSGRPEQDQSAIGLKFTGKPQREMDSLYVDKRPLDIPAGDAWHVEKFSSTLPIDTDLVSITPHAHYIAKDLAVDAQLPNGFVIRLVHIPDWNFNWQSIYFYSRPIRLPRKTRIQLTYVYDNSEGNSHNPSHPPKRVIDGESTTDEMELAILGLAPVPGADAANFGRLLRIVKLEQRIRNGGDVSRAVSDNTRLRLLLRVFDRNHDGKLDASERQRLAALLERAAGVMGSAYWPFLRVGAIVLALGVLCVIVFLTPRIVRGRRPGKRRETLPA